MRRSASLLLLLLLLLLGACDATDRTNVPWTLSQPLSYGPRPTVAAAFDQIPAAVAHNGKTFLLLWYDKRDSIAPSASSGRRIYGTRIDGTLEVLDPTGVQLLDVRDAGLGLVALGDRYLAHHAWRSGGLRTTKLWSIEADLAFTDPDALLWPTNDYEHIPRGAATDGRTMLLVLEAQRNGIDVMGVRLEGLRFEADDRGVHAVPFVIAEGADDQSEPAVACNGSLFLVAYRQHVGDQNDQIELRRVSTDGRVLDAQPITAPSTGNDNWHARVASDGKDFLVVWQRIAGDVLAARVSGDGALLDAAPMALGQGSDGWPAVAHASGRYLVAWRRDAGANGEIV
ncbi:MAG: hypothetical protein KC503_06050, partial [Myxococcales bacterium]|nr:hypothetical protein [Myxococcales bacterium]